MTGRKGMERWLRDMIVLLMRDVRGNVLDGSLRKGSKGRRGKGEALGPGCKERTGSGVETGSFGFDKINFFKRALLVPEQVLIH